MKPFALLRLFNHLDGRALRLMSCGLVALYWELVLIRWLGSTIRIVAYYSNLVLIAAFFGLGLGALLARFDIRLQRWLAPTLCGTVLAGVWLGGHLHGNWGDGSEYVWLGGPPGVSGFAPTSANTQIMPTWAILMVTYVLTALVFVFFGQWIGRLFSHQRPLRAYSVELIGSVLGIGLFTTLSWLQTSPLIWFGAGLALLLVTLDTGPIDRGIGAACAAAALLYASPVANRFTWSPYYMIEVNPLTTVSEKGKVIHFDKAIGFVLSVNNDYHQMMLDLQPRSTEQLFLKAWRSLYDTPYGDLAAAPAGPILIVGAGTGNDVSAALRNTDRDVVAVEIDPCILELGQRLHPERPYANPRVTVVNGDARSYLQNTSERFALVVFGFLDSHTLLSSFSSVRLDNFVYTRESMEQTKRILRPGGQVWLTFASNRDWIHHRFVRMLEETFASPVKVFLDPADLANGVVYRSTKSLDGELAFSSTREASMIEIPSDDWPFLYLEKRAIPQHYLWFMTFVLLLGLAALLALPRGERRLRLPYFFLGAAFFLLETSNVVSLSLLFGSTWVVNAAVFAGILCLVLAGNLTCALLPRTPLALSFLLLVASLLVAYACSTAWLLELGGSYFSRGAAACAIFLAPVYFASLIFAALIRTETSLYQAYGSNVLGAVLGGVCEYLSLLLGFKLLLVATLVCYLLAFLFLAKKPA